MPRLRPSRLDYARAVRETAPRSDFGFEERLMERALASYRGGEIRRVRVSAAVPMSSENRASDYARSLRYIFLARFAFDSLAALAFGAPVEFVALTALSFALSWALSTPPRRFLALESFVHFASDAIGFRWASAIASLTATFLCLSAGRTGSSSGSSRVT